MNRVLWLAKGLGRGGAEQLLVGALPAIDRDRYEVEVAYLLPWKDALVSAFAADGVRVHCLDNRHPADLRWTTRLRALVDERDIDLVHTHMPYVAAGARITVPRRVPMVHTEHNLWDRYRRPTRWANAATYPRNAAVIAVSDAVARSITVPRWLTRHPPPVQVIRHGADLASVRRGPAARSEGRRRLGLSDSALVVATVGNLTAKKDHATFLDAVAALARDHPDLVAVIVGTGPLEAELRGRARTLGLEPHVQFAGIRDDVYELLPGFDAFVLTSRYEGLPISLLEAMATGIPSVVTRVGGIPEVVSDGVEGFLVPPGDVGSIGAALAKLLDDPPLRVTMGAAAAARAREFDLRSAVLATQAVYDRVLVSR